jgi:hypothetical protein
MPANGFAIGGDLQLVINDSVAGLLTFDILTMTDFRQLTQRIKSVGLDGNTRYFECPEGWEVDLDFDKAGAALLNYVAANEAAYLGGNQVGEISLTSTITEVDGSTSQYQLSGGAMKLNNAGTFKGNDKVVQKASIVFSRLELNS